METIANLIDRSSWLLRGFGLAFTLVFLSGCDSIFGRHELVGVWELLTATIESDGANVVVVTPEALGFVPWVRFHGDGDLRGRTCNLYSGSYRIVGDILETNWVRTLGGCGMDTLESFFDDAFNRMSVTDLVRFSIVQDSLIIESEGDRFEFVRMR